MGIVLIGEGAEFRLPMPRPRPPPDLNPRSAQRWAIPAAGPGDDVETEDETDDLALARGVMFGMLLSIPLWMLLTYAVWGLVRLAGV